MKYNKGNEGSAIEAAKKAASKQNRTMYLAPTYFGIQATATRPASFQQHYRVDPDGTVMWKGQLSTQYEVV